MITLRDVKRMIANGWQVHEDRWSGVIASPSAPGREWRQLALASWVVPACIDALISAMGADTPCFRGAANPNEGVARPKDTSEVAPQSGDPSEDADTHGGDGASGETDHPSGGPVPAKEAQDGQVESSPAARGGGSGSTGKLGAPNATAASDREVAPAEGPADSTGSEPDSGDETPATTDAAPSLGLRGSDAPGRDGQGSARPSTEIDGGDKTPDTKKSGDAESTACPKEGIKTHVTVSEQDIFSRSVGDLGEQSSESSESSGGSSVGNTAARTVFGGQFAAFTAGPRKKPVVSRDVRDVQRALDRLLTRLDVGAGLELSPRLDNARLVRELTTRRVALSRCRREELAPSIRLILCDVSGSCSAAAPSTIAAAEAIAADRTDTIVVLHSNGHPTDCIGAIGRLDALPGSNGRWGQDASIRWWDALIDGRKVAGVVHFGDSDGIWAIEHIAGKAPVIWLDSFSACAGLRPASKKAMAELSNWQPAVWWFGVNDAKTAAIALRATRKAL